MGVTGAARRTNWSATQRLGGLVEQYRALGVGRRGGSAQLLAEVDAALDRRAVAHRGAPARDIGEFLDRLAERLGDQHPRPRGHVGDRILAEDELAPIEPAVEHAETAVVFVGVALVRIGVLAPR